MAGESIVRGQRVSQRMLERARELRRNMTPAERRLWQHLRANRLDNWHFRRQQIIDGLIVDFYCHKVGLVVEVDGSIHERRVDADAAREQVLLARGLHVLRFTNADVEKNLSAVLEAIRSALAN